MRQKARNALYQRILDGRLAPNILINPAQLTRELGVSLTPVREAMLDLSGEGLIDNHAHRGFFVRPMSVAEVNEIYPLIVVLEAMALELAPPQPDDLVELEVLNREFTETDAPGRRVDLDMRWHQKLLSRCTNTTLLAMLESLKRRAARYETAYMRNSAIILDSAEQHYAILTALGKGDRAAASARLKENWDIGPRFLNPWLKRIIPEESVN